MLKRTGSELGPCSAGVDTLAEHCFDGRSERTAERIVVRVLFSIPSRTTLTFVGLC